MSITWLSEHQIKVPATKRPLKVTGTRFASVLNLNRWSTPFKTWCEITRTYKEPFEDTIYTIAGKTIEPKQAEYVRNMYYVPDLVTPKDVYGDDPMKATHGDFFPDVEIFGGMWDYLAVDEQNHPVRVFEMKTTKRAEDWLNDVPEYYALQAALYAYLLGVDKVSMVVSFLEDSDYENPDAFVPSASNTTMISFNVSDRYPDMQDRIDYVRRWWDKHVLTGISPEYTDKDADIIKALRTDNQDTDADLQALMWQAEQLKMQLDKHAESIKKSEKLYKKLCEQIKERMTPLISEGMDRLIMPGASHSWTLTVVHGESVDKDALKQAGLTEYIKPTTTYKLTNKEN